MATMFFVICALSTYRWRKRNSMTFLLFVTVSYIALGFIKDIIFFFPVFSDDLFVENLSSLFDVACTPFVCAFFVETTRPGMLTKRNIVLSYLVFAFFIPLYCVIPSEMVILAAYILAALTAFVSMVIIPVNVNRYNKYLAENFSYTKNVSVNWIITCAVAYFIWLGAYAFCFWDPTWLGEAVFDVFTIIGWGILCQLTRNHKVIANMFRTDEQSAAESPEKPLKKAKSTDPDESRARRDDFIAAALKQCMEHDKIYLNPLLSLNDLAAAAGTNKTYISSYINSRGKTFYDYVNEYRISEACRIMETSNERLSTADVATLSGFNSISSFNRYFLKIKGVTPANYYGRRR